LRESQPVWFRDSHLGISGEKNHLDVGSMASQSVYYKGEGGGFPQVQAMVSLVCPCFPWFVLAPRVLQLCTNHFVWVVCKPVWMSEDGQHFLVPSRNSSAPLYPSKCCELKNVPRLLPLPLSFTWTHIWVLQGVGGASFILSFIILVVISIPFSNFNWLCASVDFIMISKWNSLANFASTLTFKWWHTIVSMDFRFL